MGTLQAAYLIQGMFLISVLLIIVAGVFKGFEDNPNSKDNNPPNGDVGGSL